MNAHSAQDAAPGSTKSEVVSSNDEPLIVVDSDDRQTGSLKKGECHDGGGILHRAFSLFVFDADNRLLVQKRAAGKRLWPGFWSNSCCSHPRDGEATEAAVIRRAEEELSMRLSPQFVYKFEYHAQFGDVGAEHELCWVYIARTDAQPVMNTEEVAEWRWLPTSELSTSMKEQPGQFTPWFLLEWRALNEEHAGALGGLR